MMEKTGLNRRQLADWFTKARRKLKAEGSLSQDICRIKDVKLIVNSSLAKKQKVSDSDPSDGMDPKQSDVGLSDHAKSYLERWYQVHASHPFPNKREKERMMNDMGLPPEDMKKMEGWLSRKRVRSRQMLKEWSYSDETNNNMIDEKKSLDPPTVKKSPITFQSPPKYVNHALKSQPTSAEVDNYLYEWMSRPANLNNFAPKQHERKVMEKESGIEDRRIESWFYRLRKRLKKQAEKEGLTLDELMRGLGGVLKKEREERLGGVDDDGEEKKSDGLSDDEKEKSLVNPSVDVEVQLKKAEVQSLQQKHPEQQQTFHLTKANQPPANQELETKPDLKKSIQITIPPRESDAKKTIQITIPPRESDVKKLDLPEPDMEKSVQPAKQSTATQIQDLGGLAVLASVATKAQPVPSQTKPIHTETIQSILHASEVIPTRMVSPQLSVGSDTASVSEFDTTWESSRCVSPSLCEFYEMY